MKARSIGTLTLLALVAASGSVWAERQSTRREESMAMNAGACSTHAWLLSQACSADLRDDYLVHLADCTYTVPEDEEADCKSEAREERAEAAEECDDSYEARLSLCELVGEARYEPDLDPSDFVDPNDIGDTVAPNPFWPLTAGTTSVILADGEVGVVTVSDEVRDVGGLPCRVVHDLVFEEEDDGGEIVYEGAEVTQDWYAQRLDGDVVYCGENTFEIEDGLIGGTDGSFANGTDRALAGTLVGAAPVVGQANRQEMSSDNAEDAVQYVSLAASPSAAEGGENANFPCNGGCLQTLELNPREAGGAEFKYYLPGTGFVLATKIEDGEPTGEREEVTCIGDSLDVLDDPSCGIADPDALRDALCEWSAELCEE